MSAGSRGTLQRLFQRAPTRYVASVLSGLGLAACFPRYDLPWLVWIAPLPLLLALVHERRLARAYILGALAGAVFLTGSVYWIALVMKNYAQMPWPGALGAMAAFLAFDSSYWGAFGLVTAWMARRSPGLALLASPVLWVTMDLAQTYGYFGGFPWNLLGYALPSSGLWQIATVTGVYGLSFLALSTSALAAWVLVVRGSRRGRIAAVIMVLWIGGLIVLNRVLRPPSLPQGRELAILVQPNAPLNESAENWAPSQNPGPLDHLVDITLEKLRQQPARGPDTGPPLIVWSENSAPFYFQRGPLFRSAVENLAREAGAYLVVGTVNFVGGDTERPLNSAEVIDPSGGPILQYDKIHLVPFGEYVPSWLGRIVPKVTSEAGNFVPGSNYGTVRMARGAIGIFICYEEIFPQLVRRLTPRGSGVLVNISDDAWYGDSSASFQTLEMARLRSVESRRYTLRATNDGITTVIDPYGRMLGTLPRHEQAALAGHFDYEAQETFYTAYGDIFAWLAVAAAAGLAMARLRLGSRR